MLPRWDGGRSTKTIVYPGVGDITLKSLSRIAMSNKSIAPDKIAALSLSLVLLFFIPCNSAFASAVYKVDIKKKLHGSKIFAEINKLNVPGSITMLKLSNFGTETVGCKASFDPGIDHKQSFKRILKPNTDVSIRHSTSRPPNRVKINLECRPLQKKPATRWLCAARYPSITLGFVL